MNTGPYLQGVQNLVRDTEVQTLRRRQSRINAVRKEPAKCCKDPGAQRHLAINSRAWQTGVLESL